MARWCFRRPCKGGFGEIDALKLSGGLVVKLGEVTPGKVLTLDAPSNPRSAIRANHYGDGSLGQLRCQEARSVYVEDQRRAPEARSGSGDDRYGGVARRANMW